MGSIMARNKTRKIENASGNDAGHEQKKKRKGKDR
jgi:hypothetical protein